MENFTYEDKEMADAFEETFYNTSFLGVTVYIALRAYYFFSSPQLQIKDNFAILSV